MLITNNTPSQFNPVLIDYSKELWMKIAPVGAKSINVLREMEVIAIGLYQWHINISNQFNPVFSNKLKKIECQ